MIKKINNLLLITGIIGLIAIYSYNQFILFKNEQIVLKLEVNDEIPNYYIGYIEINSLNIKVPLVYGTSKKELDQNVVGINKYSNKEHLILAGHAIKGVFLDLYNIDLNTQIIININHFENIYYVDDKKIVLANQIEIYDNIGLTLITCINKEQRLIIHAKTAFN